MHMIAVDINVSNRVDKFYKAVDIFKIMLNNFVRKYYHCQSISIKYIKKHATRLKF